MAKRTEKALAKARTRDSMSAFSKLTRMVDGRVRIVDQAPLIVPIDQLVSGRERDELFDGLRELSARYRDTLEFDRRVAAGAVRARGLRAQGRRASGASARARGSR